MEKDVKDAGTWGTEGASAAAGCSSTFVELNKPLRRLVLFVSTRFFCRVGLSMGSLALGWSGMFEALASVLCLFASKFNDLLDDSALPFSFCEPAISLVGEGGPECDDTQLFLRSLDNDRTGEMEVDDSSRLMLLLRLRPGCGSLEGSRFLLEKGKNLDDRRELLCLSCGFCSMGGGSSESAPEPSEEPEEAPSAFPPSFSSSSEMVPVSPSTAGSSRSLTRGKYV